MHAPDRASARRRSLPLVAAVVAVAATMTMLFALPAVAGVGGATPAGLSAQTYTANGNVQTWAFGGTRTVNSNLTVTNSTGAGFELTYHAYYGWTEVLTQTNSTTNASIFQLEAQRDALTILYIDFKVCATSCATPTSQGNFSAQATAAATAFGNFTRNGTVTVQGQAVPAVGILNASGSRQENLSARLVLTDALGNSRGWSLVVGSYAEAAVSLSPELGLIPYNLTPGEHWSSTSTYVLTGSSAVTANLTGPAGRSSVWTGGGTLDSTGTVIVVGAYTANLNLKDGAHTRIVVFSLTGPFDLDDGVMLVPNAGDVLSGASLGAGAPGLGMGPTAATSAVDYDPSAGHFGVDAAATSYGPAVAGAGATAGIGPDAVPASASPTVQGQPMAPKAAEELGSSLVHGHAVTYPATGSLPWRAIVVVGAIAGIAVLAIALVTTGAGRRPRTPPAAQYPPATAPPVPPGAAGTPAPPPANPPPQPSDPLRNLW